MGVWGIANEIPPKRKTVPTFGLRGGLGGGECRPPIEKPADLRRLPIRALQGGKAGNSAASLYNTPEAKVTRGSDP